MIERIVGSNTTVSF